MIDIEGPAGERATVQFKNWDSAGIVIHGQKLQNDMQNFRIIAAFLKKQTGDGSKFASMLETLAGQFEKAGKGEEPRAD